MLLIVTVIRLLHGFYFWIFLHDLRVRDFLCTENPQLGWRGRKAFSFGPVIKAPFDLLKRLVVW